MDDSGPAAALVAADAHEESADLRLFYFPVVSSGRPSA